MESHNPKKPEGPSPQAQNPINWKCNPKNPIQDPNLQTTINEQKLEKKYKE